MPWEASRLEEIEGGILKVGRAVKSPPVMCYVPFAKPLLRGAYEKHKAPACVYGSRASIPGVIPIKTNTSEIIDDLSRPREVWVSAESTEPCLLLIGPIASHSDGNDAKHCRGGSDTFLVAIGLLTVIRK